MVLCRSGVCEQGARMAKSREEVNEENVVKIKATKGPWWKSRSNTAEQDPEKTEKKTTAGKGVTAKKKRSPAKKQKNPAGRAAKATAKKSEQDETAGKGKEISAGEDTPVVEREDKPSSPGKPEKKASAKRGGRRKSAAAKKQNDKPASDSEEKDGFSESEKDISPDDTSPEERAQEPQGKAKKSAQGRGQRSRSRADKKTTSDTEPKIEAKEGSESSSEAAEDEQEKESSRQKKKAETARQQEDKKVCKLLINAEEPEECRLALLEDGRLQSLNVTTVSGTQRKNNIYKAKIVGIEPSLQAVFIDYGTSKNGFLPFSEIHPEYYRQDLDEQTRHLVETRQWKKINISDVLDKGQNLLAQVVKEEVGKKGANMTTFLSIPGRCVVLMPGSDSSGISRKISGEKRRTQLREIMQGLEVPEGIGWIVRTASSEITEDALSRDVDYLLNLWADIKKKGQKLEGVGLVYEDQHSISRFLREHFDPAIQEILVDDKTALEQVRDFVKMLPKAQQTVSVKRHRGARPIFNQYSVEDQIESIYQPWVNLPSGGSIVIETTEALVSVDVNSGSTSKGKNFEASIFQANMEAATELARQLRLRDLGGLIIVDFIDMRSKKNIMAVEKQLRSSMKKDKAKVDFSRISKFGLMQISRQKLGAPIEAGNYLRCEHCKGRGIVRSVETLSLFYLRRIQTGASRKPVERIDCRFPLDVATYLLNKKRNELLEMEKKYDVEISIQAEEHLKPGENEIVFHKAEKDARKKKQS